MSAETSTRSGISYRVLDAMDAPHSGRILRLRLQSGEAPPVKSIKGAEYLFVEAGGFSARHKPGWKPRWLVLARP